MKKKGFTLIELIVVMAVIAILVLLAAPKYKEYTNDAKLTRIKINIKELEQASQKYYMTYNSWPKLNEEAYSPDDLIEYSKRILDKTGNIITLKDGNYYDIDYNLISNYIKSPEDKENYILRNPVGSVFYFDGLTEKGYNRVSYDTEIPSQESKGIYTQEELSNFIANGYIEVKTAEDLNKVRYNIKGKYIQTANIDLSEYENWSPIGASYSSPFIGIYNGGGYTISNLTINKASIDGVGLFGFTRGCNISNVGLTNVDIVGNNYVGGLSGRNSSPTIISNSYSTGVVSGNTIVGGLVGDNYYSTVNLSYSSCSVSGNSNIGGLAGNMGGGGKVLNSYSNGIINGNIKVGGLVGSRDSASPILNSYSNSLINGNTEVGGLVGGTLIANSTSFSYWDMEISGVSTSIGGTGKTRHEMYQQNTYQNWDFDSIWQIEEGKSYPTLQWQNK